MNEAVKSLIDRAKNRSQYLLAVLATTTNRTSAEITEQEKQQVFNQTLVCLTVQECIDIVEGFETTQEVALDEYVDYEASDVLNKHFGVKE
jgi:hypothetical protein